MPDASRPRRADSPPSATPPVFGEARPYVPQHGPRLARLERLAWLLDRSIPIGRWRIGLDPILGLLPGAGDAIGSGLSLYVLYEGARLGAPGPLLFRMTGNILVETIVGAVPLLGDLFDFVWQANTRNLRLLQQHHTADWRPRPIGLVLGSVLLLGVLLVAGFLALAAWIVTVLLRHAPF